MFFTRVRATPVLLITAAINPASSHLAALDNPDERLTATVEAVDEWLLRLPSVRIVICDGSGFDFTQVVRERWPHANIETFTFVNDIESVARLGKGFGEGQIIDFALRNSRLLRGQKYFMKCTAKLWVGNIRHVLRDWTGGNNFVNLRVVSSPNEKVAGKVNTRFFVVGRKFYDMHLRDAYLSADRRRGHFIEHEFGDRLIRLDSDKLFAFVTKPRIHGVSGTTGKRV
jgi:hypothetical protein